MKTLTANDALAIAHDRAAANGGHPGQPGVFALYKAASELWDDEYDAYVALCRYDNPAMIHAANCAWERRGAASLLTQILVSAL